MIRALAAAAFLTLAGSLGMPWLLAWTMVTRRPDALYNSAMRVMRASVWLSGVRVRVEGLENIPAGACVFASNHASNLDPLVLLPAVPRRASVLVKRELFRVPMLGAGMRLADFISVSRTQMESATASVAAGAAKLRDGRSVVVFAEGTRSPDGRLRPFRPGAFAMAIEAGVPVVPVSLAGTHRLLRKGGWIVRPGEARVHFGAPVDASRYTMASRDELLSRVESLVAAQLPPDQQPATAASPQRG